MELLSFFPSMDQMKSAEAKCFLEFIITHRIKEACEAIDQEEETGDLDKTLWNT